MPQAHTVRAARVPGMSLAEIGGKARGQGDGSAVGLIFEHRWLLLPQVTWVAALLDHVPRRLPGVDSMAGAPGRSQRTMRRGTVGSNWQGVP
jgi:hypothetical protein